MGLPPDQILGEKVGPEDRLILTLRLSDGQAVPCLVDTGTSITTFDRSLRGLLGRRLRTERVWSLSALGSERAGVYAAPKLYLGDVPLVTGPAVLAGHDIWNTNDPQPHKIILGMDCLSHYCIQLDFEEHRMRFLDSNTLNREELGFAFPLIVTGDVVGVPLVEMQWAANGTMRFMVDTAFPYSDITLPPALLRPAVQSHAAIGTDVCLTFTSDTANQVFRFPTAALGSETYRDLLTAELKVKGHFDGFLGLPFLTRHKVTFDFPNRTMYLKPLHAEPGKDTQSLGTPESDPNKRDETNHRLVPPLEAGWEFESISCALPSMSAVAHPGHQALPHSNE